MKRLASEQSPIDFNAALSYESPPKARAKMIGSKTINQIKTGAEINNILAKMIEPLKLSGYGRERVYYGIGDYQGRRLILQIVVYASEIPMLIPLNPRPKNADHVREIKDYIICRIQANKAWILGSLTVNVNPDRIRWQHIGSKLYIVTIPNATKFHIIDGQHRIQAITELMASDEYQRIADEQIPLTLVLDGDSKQADSDFRDMAQTMPLPPALLVAFGAEGRDAIAQAVAQKVHLFRNNTQWLKSSPGSGSKYIYTLNYIAGLVGCAISGNADSKLLEYDTSEKIKKATEDLSVFLNRFFSCCPATKTLVAKKELTIADVSQFRSTSILGLSVGLEILGHLIHRSNATPEQLATRIDWSRASNCWSDLVISNDSDTDRVKVKMKSAVSVSQVADSAIARLKKRF